MKNRPAPKGRLYYHAIVALAMGVSSHHVSQLIYHAKLRPWITFKYRGSELNAFDATGIAVSFRVDVPTTTRLLDFAAELYELRYESQTQDKGTRIGLGRAIKRQKYIDKEVTLWKNTKGIH